MNGFVKLYASILTSTIWREDDKTRILWITLLALSDQHGQVNASVPGLAAMANMSVAECEASLQKLMNPDPYSRTKEHEGRRLLPIDGAWEITNYAKYRTLRDEETRREYQRQWDREHRPSGHQRAKQSDSPTQSDTVRQSDSSPTKSDQIRPKQKQKQKQNNISLGARAREAERLAQLLLDCIRQRKPDFKQPSLDKWAQDIDRMIRIDHRSPDRIEAVVKWCQGDAFWQNNILSGAKLRLQFDQLDMRMTTPPTDKVCAICKKQPGRYKHLDDCGIAVWLCQECEERGQRQRKEREEAKMTGGVR